MYSQYKTSKYYVQLKFTIQKNHYACRQEDDHLSFSHHEHHFIIWGFTHWTFCLTIPKNLFLHAQSFCLTLHFISVFNKVHKVFDSYLSSCFSAPLGLLGHGSPQGSWCFGKLHSHGFDGRQVPDDLIHWSLFWTDSVGNPGGRQIFQGVWGSPAQADAQFSRLEDGQGQSVPVG